MNARRIHAKARHAAVVRERRAAREALQARYAEHIAAARQGMEAAGFVRVGAEAVQGYVSGNVFVLAEGGCPCGIGRSRGQIRLDYWFGGDEPLVIGPREVENKFREMGLKHIEEDRAAGRWA